MMSRKKLALAFFLVVISMLVFPMAASAWPREIEKALWVPEGAYEVDRRAQSGVYSVSYKLNLCQPAESFISGMKRHMKRLSRWKRLDFDPYNPGLKLNHAREPVGRWDIYHHGPDGNDVMQWIDDWEDSGKNVVRYCLRYRAMNNGFQNACILEVIVSYLPGQIMRRDAPTKPKGKR